jgi:16S rRNA (guanine(966)-N(2))-methyltransferase RsmD
MQIISGKHKGRRIIAPKNLPVRPTAGMQKGALFNILQNLYYFEGLTVLDLFSGTGNIAYEFGSRGATKITSIDAHYACAKFISKTAKELELPINSIKSDVFFYLKKTVEKFDIIFADPPYDMDQLKFENISDLVFKRDLLTDKGILIVEHASQMNFSSLPYFKNSRKYGGSVFSFFEK